ncbi:hypothetical protein G9X64_06905 [Rhizobium sophorae]|uniref:Uncharacterized protein n=1 Tax=Rhizobium sophorae TaxID=1535242 RepID=A0A7Y3S386_9HYPH|nr:hypothetical protein [Rhizobium sophorae]MBX4862913.1 hypothetical protein [Rhizobium bangladeshense]NKK72894.1 hypothetical protein [Rhizobium leguminosarum bv. viciae]NKL37938.1 hypothetical protein [Rhizobium leguminosarum bv. viciae]NNU36216.1 hypothetical protein [Rhizobium sophorae]
MASPWKLLAGLVSRRRQQKQEHGSTDDVKPDVTAIAKPAETAANNALNAADFPADEKPAAHGHSAAVSADPDHAEEEASSADHTTDVESATLEKAADPASSNDVAIAAQAAPKPSRIDEGTARKRSRQAKKAEVVDVVSQPSPRVGITSDDAISLDGEIRLLRDQLARKLRLQNAQLRRMLDRFER